MLSDSFNSSSSPNKCLKTLVGTSILSSNFKSKSKMEDYSGQQKAEMNQLSADNSTSQSCVIYFREDGRVIRGEIDCCDHYFCFLCIMEWAKTKLRCPICRRRFSTIHGPPNDRAFVGERVIKVPVRDQNPTGNFDPYGDVYCTVCHCKTDDNFILLCDLCDLASHTYYVGLGVNVPEGDWFCHDCSLSRDEIVWGGWDRRRWGGGKEEERRKEKKKYKGNFGIIRKIDWGKVPKNNLGQLEGTFLVFFKTRVHFCYLRQLEARPTQCLSRYNYVQSVLI
ncbi:hypothetical protein UlMin_017477 [Ulmus minor]